MKKFNLHLHTNYSDGASTMRAYVEVMKEEGYACLCTSDHDYMMDPIKYLNQQDEAKALSYKLDFPIFNNLEISLYGEEAILINPDMCLEWFDVKDEIKYGLMNRDTKRLEEWLNRWNSRDYALILVHPSKIFLPLDQVLKPLYKLFHAYEIANCGNTSWQTPDALTRLKLLMPEALRIAGMDSHGISWIKEERMANCNNLIEGHIETKLYKDIVRIVRDVDFILNPKIINKYV